MRSCYLDCSSGIAGDMFIGAMLSAGMELKKLEEELRKLNLSGYQLVSKKVIKRGIEATNFNVLLENPPTNHRKYSDIMEIIRKGTLSEEIKQDALGIFEILANAEAVVHRKKLDNVAFHEVGGLDSIIDIVGAAICIESMRLERVYCSHLNVGSGKKVFHGEEFEVPAPATRVILKDIPTYSKGEGELVTPTGSSIVKYYCREFHNPGIGNAMEGIGAGDEDFSHSNVLRIRIGDI